ncbi:glycosyltransferase [bacterium]|nr:glycosyltransferase [bacterium]
MDGSRLSVCICTHNPRREYLAWVMAALAAQTLERERWECIVIDNASATPVAAWIGEVACGMSPRVVREERLGAIHARMRAIFEAAGDVVVYVDDDNLPAPDYLKRVVEILEQDPQLGAIGGYIEGKYEVEPPAWLRPFLSYYAIGGAGDRPVRGLKGKPYGPWYPRGAGMAVRTVAARKWAELALKDTERQILGPSGKGLGRGEDSDLVTNVLEQGLAAGYFPQLRLTHLMPRERFTYEYAARLIYSTHATNDRVEFAQKTRRPPRPWPLEYLASVILYLRAGAWHPKSWLLAMQLAKGRYEAWNSARSSGFPHTD